ncbi:MAG: HAMP domain-containing protein, partial [Kofleriaceae bacterium]
MGFRSLLARAGLRTTLVLLPIDLTFRVVVYFPTASMWTLGHGEMRNAAFVRSFLGILPLELLWIVAFTWLLAPVDRWRQARALGQSPPELLRRATRAAYRAPQRMMMVYAVQWSTSTLYAYMRVRNQLNGAELPAGSGSSLLLTVATVAIGGAAVGFTLTSWHLGPLTNELSVAARLEGVVVHETSLPLRRRLGLISVFIGGAPGCWIGALACSEHFGSSAHIPGDPFDIMLPLELAGCALFSLLCAWMFAATLTNPVARMRGVVADIIRRGDVAQVERLPVQARDEMGSLAEGVNDMIDRLEQVEHARRQIAAHLADMNLQLEAQVLQRTQSL